MTKYLKSALIGMALSMSTVFAVTYGYSSSSAVSINPSEYSTINKYNYRVAQKINNTIDTIEAWINIPNNSLGGTIVGNYDGFTSYYQGHGFNLEVDALGRIKYVFDTNAYNYTFKNTNVMDGQWHHVALIRDSANSELSLYIDGELNESFTVTFPDIVSEQCVYIGVNPCFWNKDGATKKPLEGKVKQLTLYSGAISLDRVKEDMVNSAVSTNDTSASLLGNWFFGEKWTKRTVVDTSVNRNNCVLETYEKYVGVADNRDYDYSFIIMPDVQCMNRYKHTRFSRMIDYIVDNKDELKIKFLMQVGDLSDVGTNESLYESCSEVMNKLNGKIPWSFIPGNHDYDDDCSASRSTVYYNRHFPYDIHSKLPGFGGAYEEGKMENTYYLYNIDGIKYCVINLEFGPRMDVLRWANRLCEQYFDHRIIIQTHAYVDWARQINVDAGAGDYRWVNNIEYTTPTEFYDYLVKKNKNVFLVAGGHHPCDDVLYQTSTGDYGNTIHSFLINDQASVINHDNVGTWIKVDERRLSYFKNLTPDFEGHGVPNNSLGKNNNYTDDGLVYLDLDTKDLYVKEFGGVGEDTFVLFKVNEKKKTISLMYYSPYRNAVLNIQNQFEFRFSDLNNPTIGK